MCSNYLPVLSSQRLQQHFNVSEVEHGVKSHTWPGNISPFIRKHEHADVGDEAVPFRELMTGAFGMIPHWSKDTKITKSTYNARAETVAEKNSFRDAWRLGRHCIVPAEAIFEPDYRSGKAVWTKITRVDDKPMGIAGIWTGWRNPATGDILRSFSMLTINADDHPFMRNFHKPEDEKRMVVILAEDDYDDWLNAGPADSQAFLQQFPAALMQVVP